MMSIVKKNELRKALIDFVNWFDEKKDRPKSPIVTKDVDEFIESIKE